MGNSSVDAMQTWGLSSPSVSLNVGGSDTAPATADDSISADRVLVHAVCMFVGLSALPVVAIVVSRFLTKRIPSWWMPLHAVLFCLGMGLIATAMYLIACQNGGRFPFSFSHAHAGIGSLIVYFMFPAMLMLGVYVGATWDPSRTRTPIVVRIHVWSGRVLFASSSVEIQLGLLLVKAPIVWSILFWIWTIACATLTLIARRTAKSHLVMPKPPAWTSSYSIMRKMEDKGSIELEKQSHISSRFASGSTSFEAAHTAAYCSKEPHVNWPTTPPRVESDSLSRTIRDRKFVGVDANWKKKSLPDLRRETEKVLKTKVLTDVTLIDRLEIDTRIDSADTVVPVQRIIFEEPDEIGDDMDVEMIGGRMMFEEPEELSRLPTRTQD